MNSNVTSRVVLAALAALFACATLSGMNALAGHEYRMARASQPASVAAAQMVTVVGHRTAQL